MSKFNFQKFLTKKGYDTEKIVRPDGSLFCTNYQKEIHPGIWNAISIFKNRTWSGASPTELVFKVIPLPLSRNEAQIQLSMIEKYDPQEQPSEEN